MGIHLQIYESKHYVDEETGKPSKKDNELTAGEVNSLIYSDRDKFLQVHQTYFQQAPSSQKLLGMGYAGNYKKTPKMIEMDFHDLFFSFGIIGFMMYVLPFLYFGSRLFLRVVANFKSIITVKYMLLASTITLALGIAFTAGHVLTAPAVSIFFVVIFAYVIIDLKAD